MRLTALLSLVVLGACATQDVAQTKSVARFDGYPDMLFAALESACSAPADTFRRLSRNSVECRSYMPPQATANAILNYDGTPEDLPQLVFKVDATPETPGYSVTFQAFLNVPQKSGPAVKVIHSSPAITRKMNAILSSAGGVPEPAV
ncbi:hypothetical protein ACXYMO_02735 [Arenibacterium sp. CAU 1754]